MIGRLIERLERSFDELYTSARRLQDCGEDENSVRKAAVDLIEHCSTTIDEIDNVEIYAKSLRATAARIQTSEKNRNE